MCYIEWPRKAQILRYTCDDKVQSSTLVFLPSALDQTYIFVEGTYSLSFKRVDVLQGASGESYDEIEFLGAPREDIEVVTDGNSRRLVDTFIKWVLQVWALENEIMDIYY